MSEVETDPPNFPSFDRSIDWRIRNSFGEILIFQLQFRFENLIFNRACRIRFFSFFLNEDNESNTREVKFLFRFALSTNLSIRKLTTNGGNEWALS